MKPSDKLSRKSAKMLRSLQSRRSKVWEWQIKERQLLLGTKLENLIIMLLYGAIQDAKIFAINSLKNTDKNSNIKQDCLYRPISLFLRYCGWKRTFQPFKKLSIRTRFDSELSTLGSSITLQESMSRMLQMPVEHFYAISRVNGTKSWFRLRGWRKICCRLLLILFR